jgi:ribosomal protein S18 acetylase RimI-like enzyme
VSEPRIRPATRADATAAIGLWAEAASPHASTPNEPEAVERLLEHEALLLAEQDGTLVGVLIAAWDGWRGNMYRLAVDPAHRRHGVARALVAAGEARLHSLGARRITALVAREDAVARALWLELGYEDDREIGRFVRSL